MVAMQEQWQSRRGFILATIGAAVGLGNIWRFSYVAGENGGATFLVVYLLCVFLVGAPLVVAELAVGRHAKGDAVASVTAIAPRGPWWLAGGLGVFGSFLVMCFYLVVAGWALKYFSGAVTGTLWRQAGQDWGSFFETFIASPVEPVLWQFAVLAAGVTVVAAGVTAGIERLTSILMPVLAAVILGLAIFSVSREGSAAGLAFLFEPDWSLLATPGLYLAALGQAFFSLSVGMALYLTYGSYLARHHAIPSSVVIVIAGDTLIAILCGIAIFPMVFASGMDPAAGPRLVFITLPQLFLAMPGGTVLGTLFFFLLAAAALSASISGIEVVTAYARRRLSVGRRPAALLVGLALFVGGVPASLGYGVWSGVEWNGRTILDTMDYIVSNAVLPLGGMMVALFVGWRWGRTDALRESDLGDGILGRTWLWLLRVVVPALIVVVMVRGLGT